MKNSIVRVTFTLLFAFVVFTFVTNPSKYMGVFFDGLTVWAHNVLPVLFPFALLSTLYARNSKPPKFSITKKLFRMQCDEVFFVSFLCGYPAGAKAISELDVREETASTLCSFCSTASPIFVIATVGTAIGDSTATCIVCISQLVAMMLNGLAYTSNKSTNINCQITSSNKADFTNTLTNSVLAVLSVGGLIALFFMLTEMFQSLLPLSVANHPAIFFAIGLLEMTSGILKICSSCNTFVATVCTSALLAFGGLCVAMQCFAFVSQKGVRFSTLIKMKCTQSAFATITAFVLAKLFL